MAACLALGPGAAAHAEWQARMDAAHAAYAAGDHRGAEVLYQQALADAETYGPDNWRLRQTWQHLARLYLAEDRPAEAARLYELQIALEARQLGRDHPDLIASLELLARAQEAQGDPTAARASRDRAARIRRQAFAERHAPLVPDATWIGAPGARREPGRPDALYERALHLGAPPSDTGAAPVPAPSPPTARTRPEPDPEEAELLERLADQEAVLGPGHADVAETLLRLARRYKGQRRFAYALPTFERALAILEQSLGADDPDLLPVLRELAAVTELAGRPGDALALYQRGLELASAVHGPRAAPVATYLDGAGRMAQTNGQFPDAEAYFLRSLEIREANAGGGARHPSGVCTGWAGCTWPSADCRKPSRCSPTSWRGRNGPTARPTARWRAP